MLRGGCDGFVVVLLVGVLLVVELVAEFGELAGDSGGVGQSSPAS